MHFKRQSRYLQSQPHADTQCNRCGRAPFHSKQQCPATDVFHNQCHKKGHYGKVCMSEAVRVVHATSEEAKVEDNAFLGLLDTGWSSETWLLKVKLDHHESELRMDTGVDVTPIPDSEYRACGQFQGLEKPAKPLCGWKRPSAGERKI